MNTETKNLNSTQGKDGLSQSRLSRSPGQKEHETIPPRQVGLYRLSSPWGCYAEEVVTADF